MKVDREVFKALFELEATYDKLHSVPTSMLHRIAGRSLFLDPIWRLAIRLRSSLRSDILNSPLPPGSGAS